MLFILFTMATFASSGSLRRSASRIQLPLLPSSSRHSLYSLSLPLELKSLKANSLRRLYMRQPISSNRAALSFAYDGITRLMIRPFRPSGLCLLSSSANSTFRPPINPFFLLRLDQPLLLHFFYLSRHSLEIRFYQSLPRLVSEYFYLLVRV